MGSPEQIKTLSVCEKKWSPQSKPRLRLFAMGRRKAEVRVAQSGYPKTNQDFICLLLGKRRYELLSMIEQSDIIRAISLPNATLSVNTTLLPNATLPNAWSSVKCSRIFTLVTSPFNLETAPLVRETFQQPQGVKPAIGHETLK